MSTDFPIGLGNIRWEYDYFCLGEETPILIRKGEDISLVFVEEMEEGDQILSLNRETLESEWKRARVTKNPAPEKLLRIRAKTEFDVTHNHRLLNPDFSLSAAGNFNKGDKLLSKDYIFLPSTKDSINLLDFIDKEDLPENLVIEKDISTKIPLDYESGALIGLSLTEDSEVPSFAFTAGKDFRKGIIHGWLWDSWLPGQPIVIGRSTNKKLAYGIHNLALSLEIESSVYKEEEGNSYIVQVPNSEEELDSSLEEGEIITSVKEIEYQGDWVYDIEVEDNHNFFLGKIISHNSGSQVLTYFEDILVDDILRIAWSVMQRRTPIWGYASQYFNAVAAGVVIGGGSFWIAYKEAGYIPIILRRISERKDPSEPFFASPAVLPRSGMSFSSGLLQSARTWEGTGEEGGARNAGRVQRANVERLVRQDAQNPDDSEVQSDLTRTAINLSALNDRDFENQAEMFEDAVWYGGNSEAGGRGDAMSSNWQGGDIEDGRFLALRRADQFPPFDIIVTFGDMNTPASNHTVQRLTDVLITDTQFIGIQATGEPILVQFDFICRNVI